MKCSVFIATSADGFIAKNNGSVDWLHTAGIPGADLGDDADMGFKQFMASIDCMIMGRKCMDMIHSMQLTKQQWPYGDTRIIVLSNTLTKLPAFPGKVELYCGDIKALLNNLESQGHHHAYVDGGTTIQGFINLELINQMTITRAPVLLGQGIPLFGKTKKDIKLTQCSAKAYANDFIQEHYKVSYD